MVQNIKITFKCRPRLEICPDRPTHGVGPVSARCILILYNLRQSLAKQERFCTRVPRDSFMCRVLIFKIHCSTKQTTENRQRITNYASYNYIHVTRSPQYQFLILHSFEMNQYYIDIVCFHAFCRLNLICCYLAYIILGNNNIRFPWPTYYLLVLLNISYHTNNSLSCA